MGIVVLQGSLQKLAWIACSSLTLLWCFGCTKSSNDLQLEENLVSITALVAKNGEPLAVGHVAVGNQTVVAPLHLTEGGDQIWLSDSGQASKIDLANSIVSERSRLVFLSLEANEQTDSLEDVGIEQPDSMIGWGLQSGKKFTSISQSDLFAIADQSMVVANHPVRSGQSGSLLVSPGGKAVAILQEAIGPLSAFTVLPTQQAKALISDLPSSDTMAVSGVSRLVSRASAINRVTLVEGVTPVSLVDYMESFTGIELSIFRYALSYQLATSDLDILFLDEILRYEQAVASASPKAWQYLFVAAVAESDEVSDDVFVKLFDTLPPSSNRQVLAAMCQVLVAADLQAFRRVESLATHRHETGIPEASCSRCLIDFAAAVRLARVNLSDPEAGFLYEKLEAMNALAPSRQLKDLGYLLLEGSVYNMSSADERSDAALVCAQKSLSNRFFRYLAPKLGGVAWRETIAAIIENLPVDDQEEAVRFLLYGDDSKDLDVLQFLTKYTDGRDGIFGDELRAEVKFVTQLELLGVDEAIINVRQQLRMHPSWDSLFYRVSRQYNDGDVSRLWGEWDLDGFEAVRLRLTLQAMGI